MRYVPWVEIPGLAELLKRSDAAMPNESSLVKFMNDSSIDTGLRFCVPESDADRQEIVSRAACSVSLDYGPELVLDSMHSDDGLPHTDAKFAFRNRHVVGFGLLAEDGRAVTFWPADLVCSPRTAARSRSGPRMIQQSWK